MEGRERIRWLYRLIGLDMNMRGGYAILSYLGKLLRTDWTVSSELVLASVSVL